jgi:hypothetical protein
VFEERDIFNEVGGWHQHTDALRTPMVLSMSIQDDVSVVSSPQRDKVSLIIGSTGLTIFGLTVRTTHCTVIQLCLDTCEEPVGWKRVILGG